MEENRRGKQRLLVGNSKCKSGSASSAAGKMPLGAGCKYLEAPGRWMAVMAAEGLGWVSASHRRLGGTVSGIGGKKGEHSS